MKISAYNLFYKKKPFPRFYLVFIIDIDRHLELLNIFLFAQHLCFDSFFLAQM